MVPIDNGSTAIESGNAADEQALFTIASTTKTMPGASAMILVFDHQFDKVAPETN